MSTASTAVPGKRRSAESRARAVIATVFGAMDLIALSIWLGGLVAIGALVAPSAFGVVRTAAALSGNAAAQNAIAGGIVGASLRLYNDLSLVCAAILLAAAARLAVPNRSVSRAVLAGGCLIAGAMTAFEQFVLFPAMDAARAAGRASFDAMHHEYEALAQIQLVILLVIAAAYARVANRGSDHE